MPSPSGVTVTLGGKSRVLRLTTWALCRIEMEARGHANPLAHWVNASQGSVFSLVVLVWGACLHADDELELRDVAEWEGVTLSNVELVKAVGEMIDQQYPKRAEGKAEAATAEG